MLKKGFDELGIDCDLFTRGTHQFKYRSVNRNPVVTLFHRTFGLYQRLYQNKSVALKACGYLIDALAVLPFFIYALFRYDVFIFTYKCSFYEHLGFIDLPILKRLDKKLIFVFHGTDARPPYINGSFLSIKGIIDSDSVKTEGKSLRLLKNRTRKQKTDIIKIEKYADVIVNNPPTSHFHEKQIISFLHIGIPYENKLLPSHVNLTEHETTTILHSPSNPQAKGTDTIRQAIISLKRKGHKIKYIEVIDQPNEVVLEKLAECDFVVDQVYTTNPMPGFVTEAAAFGKAAAICGYYFDQIHDVLPEGKIPPSHYLHPDEIEKAIEKLIVDKTYRLELGRKAQAFLLKHWYYHKVAERFLRLIADDIPDIWFYDPNDIQYVHGGCISEKHAKAVVKALVKKHGKEALYLSDKPELEKMFLEFSEA